MFALYIWLKEEEIFRVLGIVFFAKLVATL